MAFNCLMCVSCVLIFTAFNANASVIYAYTGNNFTSTFGSYATDMKITLQFETAMPLAGTGAMTNVSAEISSYTMFDGRKTLTDSDAPLDIYLNIDSATGLPTEWIIHATNEYGRSLGDIVNRMKTIYYSYSGGLDSVEEIECIFIPPEVGECMGFNSIAGADVINVTDPPGSWSIVPVPSAVWLFGSGLLVLTGMARRNQA